MSVTSMITTLDNRELIIPNNTDLIIPKPKTKSLSASLKSATNLSNIKLKLKHLNYQKILTLIFLVFSVNIILYLICISVSTGG